MIALSNCLQFFGEHLWKLVRGFSFLVFISYDADFFMRPIMNQARVHNIRLLISDEKKEVKTLKSVLVIQR